MLLGCCPQGPPVLTHPKPGVSPCSALRSREQKVAAGRRRLRATRCWRSYSEARPSEDLGSLLMHQMAQILLRLHALHLARRKAEGRGTITARSTRRN